MNGQRNKLITTEMLGKANVPDMKYEQSDGSPIENDTDYFGNARNKENPTPGPFEGLGAEKQLIKIWPQLNGFCPYTGIFSVQKIKIRYLKSI